MAPPGQRGRGEILRLAGDKVETNFLPGTETSIELHGLLSFASVSMRGNDVYRVRPEHGAGLCRHSPGQKEPEVLCAAGSICPPVLIRDHAVYTCHRPADLRFRRPAVMIP